MVLLAILGLVVLVAVWFVQPYSPIKSEFQRAVTDNAGRLNIQTDEVFTEEDISGLPEPVQRYFRHCGFIGTPKMSYMTATYKNADFSTWVNRPNIKITYTQVNFVKEPVRLAFIDSFMFAVPFQGFDSNIDGVGSMKGVIAKAFTLFDQRGADMDKACLVTVLSECLLVPNVALQDYFSWESIDDTHAKATISYFGITASGVFTFSENGEMLRFTTEDRVAVDFEGNARQASWSAECSDYAETAGLRENYCSA